MSSGDTGPGDTQPISQTVFEDILSRSKLLATSPESSHIDVDLRDANHEPLHMTMQEGDPGHIDLLSGFGESNPAAIHHSSGSDGLSSKDGESSPAHDQANLFSDSQQHFLTTPVTVGKLQKNVSDLATATPSLPRNPLAADLGSSGGIMALSQVFKATQAPSSPFVNGLPSGPLSDRPSPNFPIQARPMETYASSPFRTPRSNLHRTHTDPYSYVSMDESQKKRDKVIENRRTRSVEDMDLEDQSDEEFYKEPSFVRQQQRQKKIDEEISARLSGITRSSPRRLVNQSPTKLSKFTTSDPVSEIGGDAQGISEEETEQEDNVVTSTSQIRQPISSSEEDKENFVGPIATAPVTTSLAHDRLSQALDLYKDPLKHDVPLQEEDTPLQEHDFPPLEQIINVRDSQPSPSQQEFRYHKDVHVSSQNEVDRVRSSPVESSPPRKRQRRQHSLGQTPDVSPVKKSAQRRSRSPSSIPSGVRSPQHQPPPTVPLSSAQNASAAEKSSSMPSLVANTPVNKMTNNDTVPETVLESSLNVPRQFPPQTNLVNPIVTIDEQEQEDDDLPTPHHQRNWDKIAPGPSPDGTPRALGNISRGEKLLTSSSPMKGRIKSLSELSAEHSSPHAPDDEIDFNMWSTGDKEFSEVVEVFNRRTPIKKRGVNEDKTPRPSTPLRTLSPHSAVRKIDFGHATQQSVDRQEPEDSDIPEPSYTPTVPRRQRGRPSRRTENIWEIEDSPRKLNTTSSQLSNSRFRRKTPGIPATVNAPDNESSQSSLPSENSAPIQTERQTRETSISTSVVHLPGTDLPSEDVAPEQTPQPEEPVIAPNQVLASWNGPKRAYYPATFLGSCGQQRCIVKFPDSAPVEVALGSIKKLQLRIGDSVKVEWQGVPKVTHIVRGFTNKFQAEDLTKEDAYGALPVTDVHGYSKIRLCAKERKSLPGGGQVESDQTIEVPISSIYLDNILWNRLKGHAFTVDPKKDPVPTITQTPTGGVAKAASSGCKPPGTHLILKTGLFTGMVFAVSFVGQDAAKLRVTKLISENGGRILQDGFEELFQFPLSVPDAMPSKALSQASNTEALQFHLKPEHENIGFACLVADGHSRRAKYMQALALNVPCLSGRWVEDCVRKKRILSWEYYLLPAGESMYLHGAIKSRTLEPTPAEHSHFSETIAKRPKLLDGQSVLLVMGRGKAEEKRKPYIFLTYALGPERVERVLDLKTAKATLDQQVTSRWDWVYVDDREEAAAKKMITDYQNISNFSKKRKRSSMFIQSPRDQTASLDKTERILTNDFICQSLILGKVYEET
ncbi:hypothetical protein BGW36DRAFT_372546 [Talaromyces proteolyticus]|uniref:BRCT domain-containing protein n=1 Tax=Talaromyces proteolyticus TaxID=1131652 RepID=A0AAD4KW38_9EURO|nr:uncharacterized protein BGW36DRAFT_372546 [Talaromyces proteolyticus]KAH8702298.1 hypothetical protein BGW36DRAFT_372546 [Talaromyces proteolyticus]